MMKSCLQYAVIKYAPKIGKYINKLELCKHFPPRRVKDTNMSDIENTSCVRNIMRVTPVTGIKIEPWGASIIIIRVNDGVYICTRTVKYYEYKCWKKHAFVFDSHFKILHQ